MLIAQVASLIGSLSWALIPVVAPTRLEVEFYPPIPSEPTRVEHSGRNNAKWHRYPRDGLTILPYAFT